MNAYEATIRTVKRDLDKLGVRWALVGGAAVSARGAPRFTQDIDVAVIAIDDREVERLVASLRTLGYDVETILEDTESGAMATVRLRCPPKSGTTFLLDLLVRTSGIEREIVEQAQEVPFGPQLRLRAARVGHLLAMKLLAARESRPNDAADIIRLLQRVAPADLELARSSIQLMKQRGYWRDKDLSAEFERYERLAAEADRI